MSVIADIALPAEDFPLGPLLSAHPAVRVRHETLVPTGEGTIPYFWIRNLAVDAVKSALRESAAVQSVEVVDVIGDETLCRVTWTENVEGVVVAIAETEATVLRGTGQEDRWNFQLRFPDYDRLSAFHQDAKRRGIAVDLERILNPTNPVEQSEDPLTDAQREALLLAFEEGYIAVPREITLEGLADRLGISDSAVSQRIRRGLAQVLAPSLHHE